MYFAFNFWIPLVLQIYFCVIFRETRHHTQAHVTSGALVHCAPSLSARTQKAEQWLILLAIVSSGYFCWGWLLLLFSSSSKSSSNIASFRTLFRSCVSNQNFTDGFLLKFYFFPAIARDPQSSALFRLPCMMAQFQKRNTSEIWTCSTVTAKQI